jgi:D-3-phosphoglycerate dehydrogenase
MRILVLGDSYCPSAIMRDAFRTLESEHTIDYADVGDEPDWRPTNESESRLKEYLGSPSQVLSHLDGHDVLVVQGAPVSDAVLAAAPLRLVCVARGGPVNVDVKAASERGIPVVTTPGKNADAVAELTIALIVILARRVAGAMRYVDGGGPFGHDNYEGSAWFGRDLEGTTLGLIGFGQIGRRVAVRAAAFEMELVAYDPFVDPADFKAIGVRPDGLDEVLAAADHVSVHARLNADNHGMFDARRFATMRTGATFTNTARAEFVDEPALIDALTSGHLAGAALDVVSRSPSSGAHPMLACPNVVVLPHIAGATIDTLVHGGRMAAAEVARLAAGVPLLNLANRDALVAGARPR